MTRGGKHAGMTGEGFRLPDKLVLECFYRGKRRNDIVLAEMMTKARIGQGRPTYLTEKETVVCGVYPRP
ncbi:MAG: hypothetical protein PF482_07200 [Desulfobacteraceae bacterium]|nr:hypothetical protein [Desulfobacteraceae bacterium]